MRQNSLMSLMALITFMLRAGANVKFLFGLIPVIDPSTKANKCPLFVSHGSHVASFYDWQVDQLSCQSIS